MLSAHRLGWISFCLLLFPLTPGLWAQQGKLDPVQRTAVQEVDRRSEELKLVNRQVWKLAEVGLEERQSSQLLGAETIVELDYGAGRVFARVDNQQQFEAQQSLRISVDPQHIHFFDPKSELAI